MHGTEDDGVLYAESEGLAAVLRAVGVRADLVPVEGAGHGMAGAGDIGVLVDQVLDFLDEVLGAGAGAGFGAGAGAGGVGVGVSGVG